MIQSQLALALFDRRFDRPAPSRQADHCFPGRIGRRIAAIVFPVRGMPPRPWVKGEAPTVIRLDGIVSGGAFFGTIRCTAQLGTPNVVTRGHNKSVSTSPALLAGRFG